MEAIIPTLGLGTSCDVQATALFPYRPTMEQHLSFEKGETIYVSEQQVCDVNNITASIKRGQRIFYKTSIINFSRLTGGTVRPAVAVRVGSPDRT